MSVSRGAGWLARPEYTEENPWRPLNGWLRYSSVSASGEAVSPQMEEAGILALQYREKTQVNHSVSVYVALSHHRVTGARVIGQFSTLVNPHVGMQRCS